MSNLPYWAKVLIRLILLPVTMILHLIPHTIGCITNMILWVRYGGEFIIHSKDDKITMKDIYNELKKKP